MNKIYCCVVVQSYSVPEFEAKINVEISALQEQNLDVEVQFDAEKGLSALLIARKPA